ncbi:MAG: hypothetical protein ACXABY_06745 [Candidatus Thorarchaeota archaeon]|jgi:uncharacterized protein YukE
MSAELSGRVDTLENQMTFVNQDLLQRPDFVAYQNFQNVWNQELSAISDTLDTLTAQLNTLQSLYVNLNATVSSNFTSFTGYTGQGYTLLSAFTGHTGTTTGQGVHGHS